MMLSAVWSQLCVKADISFPKGYHINSLHCNKEVTNGNEPQSLGPNGQARAEARICYNTKAVFCPQERAEAGITVAIEE